MQLFDESLIQFHMELLNQQPFESSPKTPCIQQINFIEKFNGKVQNY
jgi:hypothetical protein